MIIGIPRESLPGETRVAATPQTVGQLIKLGYEVVVEAGAGAGSSFPDAAFTEAGAAVGPADPVWAADVVLTVVNSKGKVVSYTPVGDDPIPAS